MCQHRLALLMDHCSFRFATRGQCIKVNNASTLQLKQNIRLWSEQSSLFSFYALPSGVKSKGAVVHWMETKNYRYLHKWYVVAWSSLVERDEQVDQHNSQTWMVYCHACLAVYFFRFVKNTTAYHLGRYRHHLLFLLKSSMVVVLLKVVPSSHWPLEFYIMHF